MRHLRQLDADSPASDNDVMARFTLEYWTEDDWYVGRLREAPGVFSQGVTLDELRENIREAYELMKEEQAPADTPVHTEEFQV